MVNGFKIDGHFIPISFDSNGDNKLQVSELNIWCKANDMEYKDGKIKNTIPYDAEHFPEKFDKKKYSLENLKKRYPASKYEIEIYDDFISIIDKQTFKRILWIDRDFKGGIFVQYENGNDWTEGFYDKDGVLQYSRSNINSEYKPHSPLTNKLREDICHKNSWRLPNTGKDIGKHIDAINIENVKILLEEYEKIYDTTLIANIFREVGLNAETRANYAKHIVDTLCQTYDENEDVKVIKEQLYQAIDKERDKTGVMDSAQIDKLMKMLLTGRANSSNRLANELNKDVSAKNAVGLPTTGKNLGENVRSITAENVVEVMNAYEKQNNGISLLADIIEERGLNINTRKTYITHIIKAYLDSARNEGINVDDLSQKFDKEIKYQMDKFGFANADYLNTFIGQLKARIEAGFGDDTAITKPNGLIDEDFKQGNTGDCWLLASIKAIASRPKGLQILNDSIKVNNDGSVTVTLRGVNKTYTITKEELESNTQLSSGDGDIRVLEIAVNKYFEAERGVNCERDIDGNRMLIAYEILTGKSVKDSEVVEFTLIDAIKYDTIDLKDVGWRQCKNIQITDEMIDDFNNENKVITVSAYGNQERVTLGTESSAQILTKNHAYAVIRSDSEYVYLVNPWESGRELKATREQFKEFFNELEEIEL